MTDAAPDMIRAFFERWQRLEEEKRSISDDLKDLFAEMKGAGFDTKVARKVFRDKTVDQNERAEFEAIYDLYWSALSSPSRVYARDAREEHDPETGEVHDEPATETQHSPAAQSLPPAKGAPTEPGGRSGDESPVTHSKPQNPRCLKAQRGEPCKWSHGWASCSDCTNAHLARKASAA